MALLEPKQYSITKVPLGLQVIVPPNIEKACQLRFVGAVWNRKYQAWIISSPQTVQAAQLLELYPTAIFDSYSAKMAAIYWRKVAEGRAEHYGEIGYTVSPRDKFSSSLVTQQDYRDKYGNKIIDWLVSHGIDPGL